MKRLTLLAGAFLLLSNYAAAVPVNLVFDFPGTAQVYGHQPVPQVNGFDYWIPPEQLNALLPAQNLNIQKITLTADGNSLGAWLNFDFEVHLSGSSTGLPAGQSLNTLVDPVSGYARPAESQFRIATGSYQFSGPFQLLASYDSATNLPSVPLGINLQQSLPVENLTLTDGLHAQVFLWTADNRNARYEFSNVRLEIQGEASVGFVPEPTAVVMSIGLLLVLGFYNCNLFREDPT